MLRVHCQGCGRNAPAKAEQPRGGIAPGQVPAAIELARIELRGRRYDADLCSRCETQLLARFFGIEPGGFSETERELDALLGPPAMPDYLEELAS